MMPPRDFPISELRVVKLRFDSDRSRWQEELMHESQVETYLKAKLELHFLPGENPHNKKQATPLWEARVAKLGSPTSYWHTSPGLHAGDEGAYIIPTYSGKRLWAHPDLLASEKEAEELEAEFD